MTESSPFLSNLMQLRSALLRSALGFFIAVIVIFPFMDEIFNFACTPLLSALPKGTSLLAVGVVSPVMGPLRTVLFAALILSLPWILLQIWYFVAPGLYRKEKKATLLFLLSAVSMFSLGTAYCYFVVFRFLFPFIASFAPAAVSFAPDVDAYLSFMLRMFVAFGLTFETPVAVLCLVKFSLVSVDRLKKIRRYVLVGSFAVAAVLTPPDVTSQLLLALPLTLLYELGVMLASFGIRTKALKSIPSV